MNDFFFEDLELIKNDVQQYEAYKSQTNTVVIAGPGSGKTRVLTLKAISLIESYITRPSGLVCISYSRETVRELKKRLQQYGYIPHKSDFIGTVHSFSLLHVITPFAHLFPQYGVKYPVKILRDEIRNDMYEGVLNELNKTERELTMVEINKCRSLTLSGRSHVEIDIPEYIREAASLYQKKLRETEYIDFIDIINISARIIGEQQFVRETLQCKFPWLLVDEYQDLGKALHEMVLELTFNADINLYAVGDINQSIYGFNGGYPDFLHELSSSDDVRTINLESNYRSSQHIIEASLEALNPEVMPEYRALLRMENISDFTFIICEEEIEPQFEVVAKKVIPNLLAKGIPYNEIGVIVHSNSQTKSMASFLQTESIPFYIVNWGFENSAIVVWLQECAKWCNDSTAQSFNEIFRFWRKYIEQHDERRNSLENIRLKTSLYNTLILSKDKLNVFDWLSFMIEELSLKETLIDSELYPNERVNLDKLLEEARLYNLKNTPISRFAYLGDVENEVTITTRHSSKGLEFEAVILLGMEEDHFPHFSHKGNPIAIAEDQRLCYVCISRAKNSCVLIRSKFYDIYTRRGVWHKPFEPSRFWVCLHEKFGTKNNTFTKESYN